MKDILKQIYIFSGAIIALLVALFSLEYYIDSKIEKKISDPETIKQMVSILRPSLVFSLNGSIIYNIGGMSKLREPPKIEKAQGKKPNSIIWKIEISPKESLKIAPIIECINGNFAIQSKRGLGNNWEYSIEGVNAILWKGPEIKSEPLFRMEIVN
jgi:hypothetical protein